VENHIRVAKPTRLNVSANEISFQMQLNVIIIVPLLCIIDLTLLLQRPSIETNLRKAGARMEAVE
jgi:hypothetical protein